MSDDLAARLRAKAAERKALLTQHLVTAPPTPTPSATPSTGATTTIKHQAALPTAVPELLTKVSPEMSKLEAFDTAKFVANMASLHTALEAKAPGIAGYLRDINRNLNQYQELTHLLNDEQIGVIVSGLLFMSDTQIATVKATSKRGALDMTDLEALF